MGTITTAICNSYKREVMMGAHYLGPNVTPTASGTSGSTLVTFSSYTGIAAGCAITGTGFPVGTVIATCNSSGAVNISNALTSTISSSAVTVFADTIFMALIDPVPVKNFGASWSNYGGAGGGAPVQDTDIGTDEVSGTGYTIQGNLLTVTNAPALTGTTSYWTPDNTSWTGATVSTGGCLMYNNSYRMRTAFRGSIYVGSFGGTTSVTAGTITLTMPTNSSTQALLRLT